MKRWAKTENRDAATYFSDDEKVINLRKGKKFPSGFYEVSWNFEGYYEHHFFDRMKDARKFVQELKMKV